MLLTLNEVVFHFNSYDLDDITILSWKIWLEGRVTGTWRHGKNCLRAKVTGTCYHDNFGWRLGWWEWLAMSAQRSWRVIGVRGHLGKELISFSNQVWNIPSMRHDWKNTIPGRTLFPCSSSSSWLAQQKTEYHTKKNQIALITKCYLLLSLLP